MAQRLATLCFAVCFALLPLAVDAAELARRITLTDGSTHTGYILERGDNYIVLQRDDGTAVELMVSSIQQIEVLGNIAPSQGPTWTPSNEPATRTAPPKAQPPIDPPRVDAGWADEASEERRVDLKEKNEEARAATALAIAPTIPLMSAGFLQVATAPMLIGGFDTQTRFGVSIGGAVLLGSSVFTGALGAKLARDAAGSTRTDIPFRLGLGFAIGGSLAYLGSVALGHAIWAGEISNGGGNGTPASAALIGMSIGAVAAGNIIFMVDARISRNEAYKKLKRANSRRRSAAGVTPIAAPYLSPTEGGLAGGLALSW